MDTKIMKPNQNGSFKFRAGLVLLQILLPLGFYAALDLGGVIAEGVLAAAFVISMAVLIWLG